MITGDKLETAENVGISCKLLQDESNRFILKSKSEKDALEHAREVYSRMVDILRKEKEISYEEVSHDSDYKPSTKVNKEVHPQSTPALQVSGNTFNPYLYQ